MRLFSKHWEDITNDPFILEAVNGYKIEFENNCYPPPQSKIPFPYKRDREQTDLIQMEIESLVNKGVIEETTHERGEFISNIFTRPKKSGGLRIILDLSELNQYVAYNHFKMDNFQNATQILTQGCFMASLDLKDAYYSVPIHTSHRKFLKFNWQGKLFQFMALPNGLSSAPRLFTKILKPVFARLRAQGHTVIGFIDDTLILGQSKQDAKIAVHETKKLLELLGFIIHPDKSVTDPTQSITYLGFEINSTEMLVTLPIQKKDDIYEECKALLDKTKPSIRHVAKVIGKLVATFPATKYGPLWYRALEKDKTWALRTNNWHFDRTMNLSEEAKEELHWWISNIHASAGHVLAPKPTVLLQSDASSEGWGATDTHTKCGGRWNYEELEMYQKFGINYMELLAAFHAIQVYCKKVTDVHVKLQLDNTTAVAYINHMGGSKSLKCNQLAKSIWVWCARKNIWLSASHLPGKLNVDADTSSRVFNDRTEWTLNKAVFHNITTTFGTPEIDLFASRLNCQVPRYVSWHPEPEAEGSRCVLYGMGKIKILCLPSFLSCREMYTEDHS